MDEKSESEIRNLIAQGETIRAIKLYREATGAGLVHAKSAIENLERTGSFDYIAFTAETGPSESSDCVEEVSRLMKLSQKIAAVKFYREQTGCGLKEAKDSVERIASEHGIADTSANGCLGVTLLAIVTAAYCLA